MDKHAGRGYAVGRGPGGDTEDIMGFVQVVLRLPDVFRMMNRAVGLLRSERPGCVGVGGLSGF